MNSSFLYRLKFYGFGILLGVVLSIFFFQNRTTVLTSWLPGNRVKIAINEGQWTENARLTCLLDCKQLDVDGLKKHISEAEVDFSASQTKGNPKVYELNSEHLGQLNVELTNDTIVAVLSVEGCGCEEE